MQTTDLSSVAPFIIGGFVVLFFAFVMYMIFSKKGRTASLELTYGCKVVQDFGEISSNSIPLGKQRLWLFGCEKDSEKFLAIEVRTSSFASIHVNWIKIDEGALEAINQVVETST